MSNLKKIAKTAGVSVSTVSKALNHATDISRETRENILRVARELNYNVHEIKFKNIKEIRKQKVIGIICPEVNSNYYTQLIGSLGESISQKGYRFVTAVTDFKQENEEMYLELFREMGVNGICLLTESEDFGELAGSMKHLCKIPLVLITTGAVTNDLDCLKIDDHYGVITGIEYLIKLGHKKICYIGDKFTENRLKAYRDTLEKNNIELDDSMIMVSDQRFEACGYDGMKKVLSGKNRPTAVFAAYDDIAIGAMRVISEHQLSIPEDISVIGMDNVSVCSYLNKSLTTISNPIKEMALISTSILIRKIEDEEFTAVQHVVLKPELVIRETTAVQGGNR